LIIQVGLRLFSFAILFVLADRFTLTDFGLLAVLEGLAAMGYALSQFGVSFWTLKYFDDESKIRLAWLLSCTGTILMALSFSILQPLLQRWLLGGQGSSHLIYAAISLAFFRGISEVPRFVLRGRRKLKLFGSLLGGSVLLRFLLTIVFVVYADQGLWGAIMASVIAEAILFLSFFVTSQCRFPRRASFEDVKSLLKYSVPFTFQRLEASGCIVAIQMALAFLGKLESLGIFNLAWKFTLPLALVLNSKSDAWIAYKFLFRPKDENSSSEHYLQSVARFLAFGVGIWAIAIWILPYLPKFFLEFPEARIMHLQVFVSLIPLFQFWFLILISPAEFTNETPMLLKLQFLAAVICVGSFFLMMSSGRPEIVAVVAALIYWAFLISSLLVISHRKYSSRRLASFLLGWLILVIVWTAMRSFSFSFGF